MAVLLPGGVLRTGVGGPLLNNQPWQPEGWFIEARAPLMMNTPVKFALSAVDVYPNLLTSSLIPPVGGAGIYHFQKRGLSGVKKTTP